MNKSDKDKITGAVYVGKCPRCGQTTESQCLFKVAKGTFVPLPPPVITIGCQCGLPPESTELFYYKSIGE